MNLDKSIELCHEAALFLANKSSVHFRVVEFGWLKDTVGSLGPDGRLGVFSCH